MNNFCTTEYHLAFLKTSYHFLYEYNVSNKLKCPAVGIKFRGRTTSLAQMFIRNPSQSRLSPHLSQRHFLWMGKIRIARIGVHSSFIVRCTHTVYDNDVKINIWKNTQVSEKVHKCKEIFTASLFTVTLTIDLLNIIM